MIFHVNFTNTISFPYLDKHNGVLIKVELVFHTPATFSVIATIAWMELLLQPKTGDHMDSDLIKLVAVWITPTYRQEHLLSLVPRTCAVMAQTSTLESNTTFIKAKILESIWPANTEDITVDRVVPVDQTPEYSWMQLEDSKSNWFSFLFINNLLLFITNKFFS